MLGLSERHSLPARAMLSFYGRQGSFDNVDDTEDALRRMVGASFEDVDLEVIGSIAVFSARRPRPMVPENERPGGTHAPEPE